MTERWILIYLLMGLSAVILLAMSNFAALVSVFVYAALAGLVLLSRRLYGAWCWVVLFGGTIGLILFARWCLASGALTCLQ